MTNTNEPQRPYKQVRRAIYGDRAVEWLLIAWPATEGQSAGSMYARVGIDDKMIDWFNHTFPNAQRLPTKNDGSFQ